MAALVNFQRNGVIGLQFPHLLEFSEIGHAVFTRSGGFSRAPFRSLNTSFGVGDNPDRVAANRNKIQTSLAAPEMMFSRQVHGVRVLVLAGPQKGPSKSEGDVAPAGDAMITDLPGKFLVIQVADCQAVMLYDPVRRVVANIHSGWRGSIQNVIGRSIVKMTEIFGTKARDLVAGIGPSLGPCCAEFVHYRREIPPDFWSYRLADDHFDFWAISRDQLRDAGVACENIFNGRLCTRCRPDLFFSYRGEGVTGRFAAVVGLL